MEFSDLKNIKYTNETTVSSRPFTCGYCSNTIAPNRGYQITYSDENARTRTSGYVYICPYCKKPIFYNTYDKQIFPGEMYGRDIKNLPNNLQYLYNECRQTFSNGCYTSSVLMARKILMNIAVEQGAKENLKFIEYVNYLDEQGYIPPNGKAWVDYIRKSGNEATHEIVVKEKEEAEKVITFLSTLLLVIYELPNSL